MTQAPSRDDVIQQDVADLHKLGYAQELFRSMGGFSNFAISFSIISILTGAVILYDYGLAWAGTAAVLIGWPFVTVFVLCIAASMGEIASAYPTAGGLYYWASRMKNKNWGWWTAWLNLIGQFAIVAGHQLRRGAVHQRHDRHAAPVERRHRVRQHDGPARIGRPTDPRRFAADDGHPHARPARHQHRRHQPRRAPEPGQRVVAHRDRRGGRRPRVPGRQARRVRPDPVRHPAPGRRRQLEQQPRVHQPRVRPRHHLPADPRLLLLAAPGQLDVHRLRRLGPRRGGDGRGAEGQRVGDLPVGRGERGRRVHLPVRAVDPPAEPVDALPESVAGPARPIQPVLLRRRRGRHRHPHLQPRADGRRRPVGRHRHRDVVLRPLGDRVRRPDALRLQPR